MRIGQNPAKVKGSPAYRPARVGLATLTYIPALEGYFRESLDVLAVHLASLHESLGEDCDLCVFDNGSCPQVRHYLDQQWQRGWIDWLCLSNHNLGKNGALNWILAALPNDYIAYSDSDVFFRKGWLQASLEVFGSFERAGMVSAQPVFFDFLRGQGKTIPEISACAPDLEIQAVQPDPALVEEYCDGINAPEEMRQQFRSQRLQMAVNHRSGARAVTSATDMQFMVRKEVAMRMVPMPIAGALTGKDAIEIPRSVEAAGYWILSTEKPLVWHMGNSLSTDSHPEIHQLSSTGEVSTGNDLYPRNGRYGSRSTSSSKKSGMKSRLKPLLQHWVRRSPVVKRWVGRIYDGLFSLLYEES